MHTSAHGACASAVHLRLGTLDGGLEGGLEGGEELGSRFAEGVEIQLADRLGVGAEQLHFHFAGNDDLVPRSKPQRVDVPSRMITFSWAICPIHGKIGSEGPTGRGATMLIHFHKQGHHDDQSTCGDPGERRG